MSEKTFRAKTIQEAVGLIKKEMGPDAMIHTTRKMPFNPRDPYNSGMFEVTAIPGTKPEPKTEKALLKTEKPVRKKHLPQDESLAKSDSQGFNTIKAELVSIREMLYLISRNEELPDYLQSNPEWLNLYAKLVNLGISEKNAQELIKASVKKTHHRDKKNITMEVLKGISDPVKTMDPFNINGKGVKLAAFVGPTGVGKTTTIAKIAAELCLKRKQKVGLISIDSYRVGAIDQLKTYSSIMGIPCLAAFNSQDLKRALETMSGMDVILIDTAGLSQFDKERMDELSAMIDTDQNISCHLVLSVTTDRLNMADAVRKFSVLNPETYVFTKFDETERGGVVVDQLLESNMPVSYLTNGQKVPEDIFKATRRNILQSILT